MNKNLISQEKLNKRPIFILSTGRAGSTLLKWMLDKHSEICAPSELHLLPFQNLEEREQNFSRTELPLGLVEAIKKVKSCSIDDAKIIYDDFKVKKYTSADIYNWFLQNSENRYFVDKSPTYSWNKKVLYQIEKINPAPIYIYLFREPVPSIESCGRTRSDKLIRMVNINANRMQIGEQNGKERIASELIHFELETISKYQKDPHAVCERIWNGTNLNIQDFLKNISDSRQHWISYENMVNNSEREMNKICSFLELDYEQEMLNPYAISEKDKENVGDKNFYSYKCMENQNHKTISDKDVIEEKLDIRTIQLASALGYNMEQRPLTRQLLFSERAFLKQNTFPDNYCLVTTFESIAEQEIDKEKLEKALRQILLHTPELSFNYKKVNGEWQKKGGLYREPSVIMLEDDNYEKALAKLEDASTTWTKKLRLENGLLFAVFVLKTGQKQFIRYVFHHLLTDGFALNQFHQNLWKSYMSSVSKPYFSRENIRVSAYQKALEDWLEVNDMSEKEKQWNEQSLKYDHPFPMDFNVRKTLYKSQEEYTETIDYEKAITGSFHFNEIVAALYSVVAEIMGQNEISIAHRFGKRKFLNKMWNNFAAWMATDVPIIMDAGQCAEDIMTGFKSKVKQLTDADFMYENASVNDKLPALHEWNPIRLNYIPIVEQRGKIGQEFKLLESTLTFDPNNEREYMIDFIVREKVTSVEVIIRYSTEQFKNETIAQLFANWKDTYFTYLRNQKDNTCLEKVLEK